MWRWWIQFQAIKIHSLLSQWNPKASLVKVKRRRWSIMLKLIQIQGSRDYRRSWRNNLKWLILIKSKSNSTQLRYFKVCNSIRKEENKLNLRKLRIYPYLVITTTEISLKTRIFSNLITQLSTMTFKSSLVQVAMVKFSL